MVRAVAAVVAAASLYSRLASFALLALAARVLSFPEFGVLAVAVGAAVAVANTFAVGAGDQIAAHTVTSPRAAWRFMVRSSAALLATAAILTLATPAVTISSVSVVTTSVSICVSTASCMTTMNYLRGCGWVATGSILAYVLMPTLRTAAVAGLILANSTTLLTVMNAVNLASIVAAVIALAFANFASRRLDADPAIAQTTTRRQAVFIGTVVALAWGILGQGDVTALAIFRDTAAAGEYTPTMRVMEALTALALGVKFAGTRQMVTNSGRGLQSRILTPWSIAYCMSAALVLLAAPAVVTMAFGEAYKFDYQVAMILAPAYFLSSIVSMLLQILIARGSGSQVASWTLALMGMAVVLLAAGAVAAGTVGVASADLLIFGTWLVVLLRLEVKSRRDGGTA